MSRIFLLCFAWLLGRGGRFCPLSRTTRLGTCMAGRSALDFLCPRGLRLSVAHDLTKRGERKVSLEYQLSPHWQIDTSSNAGGGPARPIFYGRRNIDGLSISLSSRFALMSGGSPLAFVSLRGVRYHRRGAWSAPAVQTVEAGGGGGCSGNSGSSPMWQPQSQCEGTRTIRDLSDQ